MRLFRSLFKRRTKGRKALLVGRFMASVSGRLDSWFNRLAIYLNRKTCYWNRTAKLTALFLFCLLFGGICLWLLCKALVY